MERNEHKSYKYDINQDAYLEFEYQTALLITH